MNTILTILLLVALSINIVCDIVRLFTFCRTVEESKENAKETVSRAVGKAYKDWYFTVDDGTSFMEHFHDNFDKYL